MDLLGDRLDAREQRIRVGPYLHAARHEADGTKAAEQVDHAVDVGGVIACMQQAASRDVEVGKRFFELDARDARARDDARFGDVAIVVIFVARLRVLLERLDRGVLRVRPRAFGRDVGTHAADDLEARRADRQQQQHDRDERPDEPDEPEAARLLRRGRWRHE